MANISNLIKRAEKLAREVSLRTLLDAIAARPLSQAEQTRFLERIMAATLSKAITPQESRTLAKAINKRITGSRGARTCEGSQMRQDDATLKAMERLLAEFLFG
jgi:hypothetical protein